MTIEEGVGSDLDMDLSEEEETDFDQDQYEDENDDEIGDEGEEEEIEETGSDEEEDRLSRLEEQVGGLGNQLSSQIAELKQGLTPARKTEFTEEQLNEMYKKNPVAVMRYLSENQAQKQNVSVQRAMAKQKYDDQAKANYPLQNPKFYNTVAKHFEELMADGMSQDSPKLLLNACKLAAAESGLVKKKKVAKKPVRRNDTVERSDAPRRRSKSLDVNSLPRQVKNQVDLYAAAQSDPAKVEKFAKDAMAQYKASKRRRG